MSVFTVAKEVGHNSTATTERVYSQLGEVHHRGEGLEYRLEDHADTLKGRLAGHGFVLQDEK